MKIVYLHQYFNTPKMPGGTRSYEMARRLVDMGHEVHMITSWRQNDGHQEYFETEEAGIHVHWLPIPYSNHMNYNSRIWAFLRFAMGAARKAASLDVDLVFATSTPLTIALPAVYVARRQSIPMVFEVRDLWPEIPIAIGALNNPILRVAALWLEQWAYSNSETVVALSPGMRDGVCRTGYPSQRVSVIPNCSDNTFFYPDSAAGYTFRSSRPWLKDRPLLVYTGTFGKINGVGYLVELASELLHIDPEIRLLLIGDGLEHKQVLNQAQVAGVLNLNLYLEPKLPKDQIPTVLAAADMAASLFIDIPEMQANSANKFFDALASGTPVLLNYGGWQAQLVETTNAGLVTWRMPILQAAECIAAKLNDRVWLQQAGKNARNLAEQKFNRDILANKLEKILTAAVSGQGQKASEISPSEYFVNSEIS
ncbi:glycosyltransferase family 4 protein [Sphaerospermopsis torques-reginae]|uniref:Glycosyltransferase family 4 protein n=1 Tax=Sphaerospermopsis torques-reginae ITEP-024 TaxID=984208 RepID=A0ABX8WU19_9CYAN|nr:glycosyltransferase family 4 protein [Sphaerospermopsis torques-reginae]QYX29899.1 glycosyltransferase family 4 protein [Sphaerospermopsis torques-reginae ITEP-024]